MQKLTQSVDLAIREKKKKCNQSDSNENIFRKIKKAPAEIDQQKKGNNFTFFYLTTFKSLLMPTYRQIEKKKRDNWQKITWIFSMLTLFFLQDQICIYKKKKIKQHSSIEHASDVKIKQNTFSTL